MPFLYQVENVSLCSEVYSTLLNEQVLETGLFQLSVFYDFETSKFMLQFGRFSELFFSKYAPLNFFGLLALFWGKGRCEQNELLFLLNVQVCSLKIQNLSSI